jgi:hypothetical protein
VSRATAALAVFLLVAPRIAEAEASSYPEPPGTWFVDLGYTYFQSSSFFDQSGIIRGSPCAFQKDAMTIYAEYGANAKDTLSISTEYDTISNRNAAGSVCSAVGTTSGLNDIELGLTHNVYQGTPGNFGYQVIAIVPGGYSSTEIPPIGYGRPGAQAGIVFGKTFKFLGTYGFFDGNLGVRAYTGYPAPQLRSYATVGIDVAKPIQLLGTYSGVQALGAGGVGPSLIGSNPFTSPSYDYVQLGGQLRIRFSEAASLVAGFSDFVSGKNVGDGRSLFGNVWLRF